MYTEQLAVLLFLAVTQSTGQGMANQTMAQMPRERVAQIGAGMKIDPRLTSVSKQRSRIKREREAMMLAEFH